MTENYSIRLNEDAAWEMQQFHFHDAYEILLSLTGCGYFWVDDRSYELRSGSLILLESGMLHRSIVPGGVMHQRYVLHFLPEYAASLSSRRTNLLSCFGREHCFSQLSESQCATLVGFFNRCMKKEEGFGGDLRSNIAFVELLLCVSELVGKADSPAPAALEEFEKIRPVLSYIREHLGDSMTLDEIAREAFISKHYLCHLFKKVTGFSVGEYISSSRILMAQEHLRSGMNVQRSGELAGFPNNSHFIRTFHAMVGISPGKYARRHRQSIST